MTRGGGIKNKGVRITGVLLRWSVKILLDTPSQDAGGTIRFVTLQLDFDEVTASQTLLTNAIDVVLSFVSTH